jgi:diguanylate cyclase (GGDEF)-like protein
MIMDRRRLHQSDHYYWLTALIAARGGQTTTCRVIAALIFGVGIIPSAVVGTYSGPDAARDRILAIAITLCCAALASLWLRARWPSRVQSQLCVVLGTVCVAVACLIVGDPAFGLLGATSFGALAAFVAFFHTARLLAFTWLVGACVLVTLAVQLAATSTSLAIASVALVALVNAFAVFACRMVIRLLDTETMYGEIEPLTGLLNRDAFYHKVATLIGARSRDDDQFLVVAVLSLDSYSLLVGMAGGANGDRARVEVGQRLRETVRQGALVAHVGDTEFMIVDVFTSPDPSALVERALGAVSTTPPRMTASIGVVTTPLRPLVPHPPHDVLDEILAIATTAMHDARRDGGNRARYVLRPDLRIFDDTDDFGVDPSSS